MPLKIIRENYVELVGKGPTLISSPPIVSQRRDLYCGQLVEEIALLSKTYGLIAKVTELRLEESAQKLVLSDFDGRVANCIKEFGIRCVVEIAGSDEPGIQIAERNGSDEQGLSQLLRERLAIQLDIPPSLESSAQMHQIQEEVPMVSIALGPDERGFRRSVAVGACVDAISLLNRRLGYSGSDEGISDTLD